MTGKYCTVLLKW